MFLLTIAYLISALRFEVFILFTVMYIAENRFYEQYDEIANKI
jgi:hypothetical protein